MGVMENYAANFGKDIGSKELVRHAKIEYNRSYTHTDQALQNVTAQKGQPKEGEQIHSGVYHP